MTKFNDIRTYGNPRHMKESEIPHTEVQTQKGKMGYT